MQPHLHFRLEESAGGWSRHHPDGLIYHEPNHCYRGYTIVAPSGPYAYLIDMDGRVCPRWHSTEGSAYAKLLPNGHLLFRSSPPKDIEVGTIGGPSAMLVALIPVGLPSMLTWFLPSPKSCIP